MESRIERPNLLELRLARGWTQQIAAEHADMSRSYYAMIETQNRTPSIAAARKLASIFRFSWTAFFHEGGV